LEPSASPFDERFHLMLESGQMQPPVLEIVMRIIHQIEQDYNLTLDEDNAGVFVTHVALALQRLADDEALESIPSLVLDEARTFTRQWAYAEKLAATVASALNKSLPEGEIGYLTIHLERLVQETAS
jgi:transcriptional regulatory protein LevR